MPRSCGVCSSLQRSEHERRVLNGEPIRFIAADLGIGETAVRRHVRLHLAPSLRVAVRSATADLHAADFADRLAELVDATESVRARARQRGDDRLSLQAIASERDTLMVLMARLGIDGEETAETLAEARALAVAVRRVVSQHPEVGDLLVTELTGTGQAQLTDAIQYATDQARLRATQTRELPA